MQAWREHWLEVLGDWKEGEGIGMYCGDKRIREYYTGFGVHGVLEGVACNCDV